MSGPAVTVVTVAYGAEPWLERSVDACLASHGVDVDVVLVDNGCTDGAIERLRDRPRVTVVNDGSNTGFAEGCNIGVRTATGTYVELMELSPAMLDSLARMEQAHCQWDGVTDPVRPIARLAEIALD